SEGSWFYSGSIADPCQVTAIAYHDLLKETTMFAELKQDLLPDTTYLCIGETSTLKVSDYFTTNLWSTGETASSIDINAEGKYWVRANNGCDNPDTTTVRFVDQIRGV